jgi:hypothetical protein
MIFNKLHGRVSQHLLFWGVASLMIILAALVHIFVERRYSGRLKRIMQGVFQPELTPINSITEPGKL